MTVLCGILYGARVFLGALCALVFAAGLGGLFVGFGLAVQYHRWWILGILTALIVLVFSLILGAFLRDGQPESSAE